MGGSLEQKENPCGQGAYEGAGAGTGAEVGEISRVGRNDFGFKYRGKSLG